MLLEICILCSIAIVLLGNSIYVLVLIQRRFSNSKTYLKSETTEHFDTSLNRTIMKVNGWLYLLILFNCIHYSFGPWSIIFSILCFLTSSTGKTDLSIFCSVFATISSSIMLFSNPSKKYDIVSHTWKEACSRLEMFLIQLPKYSCENEIRTELGKLSDEISNISKKIDI